MTAKEIGGVTLLTRITDHSQGLVTPALDGVQVTTILAGAVDEPDRFARRITHLRSYLGAYTGTFRTGGTVLVAGELVHLRNGGHSGFGVELTPWNTGTLTWPTSLGRFRCASVVVRFLRRLPPTLLCGGGLSSSGFCTPLLDAHP
ncbi:hypothetical protein [Streptomyces sp. NPDC004721]